jgi:hypothetical protein
VVQGLEHGGFALEAPDGAGRIQQPMVHHLQRAASPVANLAS